MIRAIFRQGLIEPLESVPADWAEGTRLMIDEMKGDEVDAESTGWFEDMESHANEVDDDDIAALNDALAVAKAEQKQLMRLKMGLPQ